MEFIDPEDPTARRVFLSAAENPSDFMAFAYLGDSYQVTSLLGGAVESGYASGRSRIYSSPGDTTTVPVGFEAVTADQIAWLLAHRGMPVCFRDHLSRKVFVAYFDAPVTVSTDSRAFAADSAALSMVSVSWDEAAA